MFILLVVLKNTLMMQGHMNVKPVTLLLQPHPSPKRKWGDAEERKMCLYYNEDTSTSTS
jgi:hypothetical protein